MPGDRISKDDSKNTLYCSFCGKSQHEVRKLIAGPTVFICNECTELCMGIISEEFPNPANPLFVTPSCTEKLVELGVTPAQLLNLQEGQPLSPEMDAEQFITAIKLGIAKYLSFEADRRRRLTEIEQEIAAAAERLEGLTRKKHDIVGETPPILPVVETSEPPSELAAVEGDEKK